MYSLIMTIMLSTVGNSSVANTTIDGFTSEAKCNVASYTWAGRVNEGVLPNSSISIVGLCVKM